MAGPWKNRRNRKLQTLQTLPAFVHAGGLRRLVLPQHPTAGTYSSGGNLFVTGLTPSTFFKEFFYSNELVCEAIESEPLDVCVVPGDISIPLLREA